MLATAKRIKRAKAYWKKQEELYGITRDDYYASLENGDGYGDGSGNGYGYGDGDGNGHGYGDGDDGYDDAGQGHNAEPTQADDGNDGDGNLEDQYYDDEGAF